MAGRRGRHDRRSTSRSSRWRPRRRRSRSRRSGPARSPAIFHPEGTMVEVGRPIIAIDTDPGAGDLPADLPAPSAASLAAVEVAGDAPVEPGMIGGPAPGGRTAVLVGYGPKTAVGQAPPAGDGVRAGGRSRSDAVPQAPAPTPAAAEPPTPASGSSGGHRRRAHRPLAKPPGAQAGPGPRRRPRRPRRAPARRARSPATTCCGARSNTARRRPRRRGHPAAARASARSASRSRACAS